MTSEIPAALTKGVFMPAKKKTPTHPVVMTIGLPVTSRRDDQLLLRKLDRLKVKRGFRARTQLIRVLILEEFARRFPGTQGSPK